MTKKLIDPNLKAPVYHFFCINTTLNDYHLCWAINETLQYNLTRKEDLRLGDSMKTFSVFQGKTENSLCVLTLLSLKSESSTLMKELTLFDFLVCIEGHLTHNEIVTFQTEISKIKNVILITKLVEKDIKVSIYTQLSEMIEMIGLHNAF